MHKACKYCPAFKYRTNDACTFCKKSKLSQSGAIVMVILFGLMLCVFSYALLKGAIQ